MTVSQKALTLYSALQSAFQNSAALGLKFRFLFALNEKTLSPKEVSAVINQDKTNVAHLAKKLQEEGLIAKSVLHADNRSIRYSLTIAGKDAVDRVLNETESRFRKILDSAEEKNTAIEKFDEVIRLLSFL